MKRTFIYPLAIFILLVFGAEATVITKTDYPKDKKVVLIRPSRPHVKVFKPVNIKSGYVWIEGHWKWNRKLRNYVWVDGHLVKRKKGKIWLSGQWESLNGGWIYTSGKWA